MKSYGILEVINIVIDVVDSRMGTGKTTAMIRYINELPDDIRVLYITPYLTEVEHIICECEGKRFEQPKVYGSKINGIKDLIEKGKNIASTHSLFLNFNEEIIDLIYNNNYILVLDEVASVVDMLDITKPDFDTILEKYAVITDDHMLKWKDESYSGKFNEYKQLCDMGCVAVYGDHALVWLFPVNVFNAFKRVFVLTYLFSAQIQRYYYDFFGFEYRYLYVTGDNYTEYRLTEEPRSDYWPELPGLIHILDNEKMNEVGKSKTALSKAWYRRNAANGMMKRLRKNCMNFFLHYTQTKTQYNLWTTFKPYRKILSGKGYTKGYIALNARASNNYHDRYAVAYLVNRYLNTGIKQFFIQNGINVNEDLFALSEMLQFIWRSAIRDGKEIWLYIPSSRMRELLTDWIDNISKEKLVNECIQLN